MERRITMLTLFKKVQQYWYLRYDSWNPMTGHELCVASPDLGVSIELGSRPEKPEALSPDLIDLAREVVDRFHQGEISSESISPRERGKLLFLKPLVCFDGSRVKVLSERDKLSIAPRLEKHSRKS